MFINPHGRMALLAGLLGAALSVPALAADVDGQDAQATISDQQMVATSSAAKPGPVVARETLAPQRTAGIATVGGGEPTRSTAGLSPAARRAARAARAASAGSGYGGYKSSGGGGHPLILGVRF
jgi:hypothetical protein